MTRLFFGILILAVAFFVASPVFAQEETEKGSIEGIFGAGYVKPSYFTENSGGYDFFLGGRVRFSLAPEKENFIDRLGVLVGMEFMPVSSEKFQDPQLDFLKASERQFTFKTGLSLNVMRRERFDLFLNGGAAFTLSRLSFSVPGYGGSWQNVCRYLVDGVCKSSWSTRGSFEPEFRFYTKGRESSGFFMGVAADIPLKRMGFTIGTKW